MPGRYSLGPFLFLIGSASFAHGNGNRLIRLIAIMAKRADILRNYGI